jgi:hypothetical protein
MGWESRRSCRGRYYTRSKRANGRVVREYVGTAGDPLVELVAAADALRRADRRAAAEARRAEQARWAEATAPLKELSCAADLLARAAFLSAGFHRHARSLWRKKRHGHDDNAPEARRDP